MTMQSVNRTMRNRTAGLGLDQPTAYEIVVEGGLDEGWSEWFDGLEVSVESCADAPTQTRLAGIVADQADLHGILEKIRNLGLPLISVARIGGEGDRKGEGR